MKPFCFANNQIIPSNEAVIHPMDVGLIRGYGIFDFFRTVDYNPFFVEDYLDRFIRSAQKTHLNLDHDKDSLIGIIMKLIEKNDLHSGGIRMLLSGGISENHFSPGRSSLFIFCEELLFPNKSSYENGVKLISVDHVRAISDIKTTNYAFPVWHSQSENWKGNGAEDVLYHHNGFISESSRSNIFIIKNQEILTPDQNILHGITRKRVLELSGSVKIQPITFEDTIAADEIFMTSTTKKILPISKIDNHQIGSGKPGPITQQLMGAFENMEKNSSKKMERF